MHRQLASFRVAPPLFAVALAALAVAFAWPAQERGCNQTAHHALVKSLADGRPEIDPYQTETCDKSWYEGHFYATKAPGLAFMLLPAYALLDGAGALPEGERTMLWLLGVLGAVIPAVVLLVLVRRAVNDLEPGVGTIVAVALGAATLVLPFATMLFSHVLAALLGFASFLVLRAEREGVLRVHRLALAGLLAGLAVTIEYPLALLGAILGLYVVSGRSSRLQRGASFAAGAFAGSVPFLLFNWWSLGSPFRNPYSYWVQHSGQSGHDVLFEADGVFGGLSTPDLREAVVLLAGARGLLTLTPLVALGVVGAVLLYRRGRRAEAATILAVGAAYVTYNSGFVYPIGGDSPGPRYLIPALPFLALGLGPAFARFPLLSGVLALVSCASMTVATATDPLLGHDDTREWARLAADGEFTHTVVTLAGGGRDWVATAPFFAAVAVALVAAAATAPRALGRRDWTAALAGTAAWATTASLAPGLLAEETHTALAAAIVLVLGAAASAVAFAVVAERRAPRQEDEPVRDSQLVREDVPVDLGERVGRE